MERVSIRELRNHGGEVVERVTRGEPLTITRDGTPVAELRPIARPPLSATALLQRWHCLPPVDPTSLQSDIDEVLDSAL